MNEKIQLSEIGFEQIIAHSPVAMFTCDDRGLLTFYNHAAVNLWGRKPQLGKETWLGNWRFYFPDGRRMLVEETPITRLLAGEKIDGPIDVVIANDDLSFRSLAFFAHHLTYPNGAIKGVAATLIDVTSYRADEEKQRMLSAVIESSDDAIISKSLEGTIQSWNLGAFKIFGYTREEVIGKNITMLIPEHLQSEEGVIMDNIRHGKTVGNFQTLRLHKTGRLVPISLTVSPLRDNFGNITGASKVARDISERVHADEIISQVAQKMAILNSIGKTISEKLDVQVILQKVTDATTTITGAAFGAFFYNTIDENGESFMLFTLSGAPREAFEKFGMPRNTAVFNPTFTGQGVVRVDDITKDPRYGKNQPHSGMPKGHLPVVSYMAVPVISNSGRIIGGLFFGHPKSSVFKEEHEDLIVSIASQAAVALDNSILFEEVKALSAKKDEFIALASHELKTPLTSIKGYLQILERKIGDSATKVYITKLLNQSEKLEILVNELFDISRIESGKLTLNYETFDLKALLAEVIEACQPDTSFHTLDFEFPDQGHLIEADKHRIEQVITNLLGNAIKYSPHGGKVNIKLYFTLTDAHVSIKDEGMGMSKEQLSKMFTRFYRAENLQGISGLGLGLYLSKEIIDRHSGDISASSELKKGSEFSFRIPLKKHK